MATVGRVCVLPPDLESSIVTKHCYRITADDRIADPEFLGIALRAESPTRLHIYGNIRGQTRPGINGPILKLAPLALAPRAEQEAIVEAIEDQFYAGVLQDAGLSRFEYVEQLTPLLFLKMADQLTEEPYNRAPMIPPELGWKALLPLDGAALEDQYRKSLEMAIMLDLTN
jgi:hypothetical protein